MTTWTDEENGGTVWSDDEASGTALGAANGSSLVGFVQSGTGAATDLTVQGELRKIVRASQFSGATFDVKVNAAISSLPSTGGIVDCTDMTSAQTIAATITVGAASKPVWLKLGRTSFSVTSGVGSGAAINIVGEGSAVTGFPIGAPSSNGAGTIITSATGHTGKLVAFDPAAVGDSRITIADLFLDSNSISAYALYIDHFAGVRIYRVGAARSTTDCFRIGPTAGSYTVEMEDCYGKDGTTSIYHVSATLVKMTRCVSDGGQYSVIVDGTDGNGLWVTPGCHFEGATVAAIRFNGTSGGNTVMGAKIYPYGKNANGIALTNTAVQRNNVIVGNRIIGQGDGTGTGVGITVEGTNADTNVIEGNVIQGVEYGLSLTADNCTIGPNFIDTKREGVSIAGDSNTITGGRISTAGTNAVNVSSGSGNICIGVSSAQAFAGIKNLLNATGTWTPADASGTTLSFTVTDATYVLHGDTCFVQASVTYPATADASAAKIGGLPFTARNGTNNVDGGSPSLTDVGSAFTLNVLKNTTNIGLYDLSASALPNSTFSGKTVRFGFYYRIA